MCCLKLLVKLGAYLTYLGLLVMAVFSGAFGMMTMAELVFLTPLVGNTLFSMCKIFVALGSVVVLLSVLGAFATYSEKKWFIAIFFMSMLVLFLTLVAGSIWLSRSNWEVQKDIETRMKTSFSLYPTDVELKQSWDKVQLHMQCCGIDSYNDWTMLMITVPEECVPGEMFQQGVDTVNTTSVVQGNQTQSVVYYKEGCLPKTSRVVQARLDIASGMGFAICCLFMLGMIFSGLLLLELSNFDERDH